MTPHRIDPRKLLGYRIVVDGKEAPISVKIGDKVGAKDGKTVKPPACGPVRS